MDSNLFSQCLDVHEYKNLSPSRQWNLLWPWTCFYVRMGLKWGQRSHKILLGDVHREIVLGCAIKGYFDFQPKVITEPPRVFWWDSYFARLLFQSFIYSLSFNNQVYIPFLVFQSPLLIHTSNSNVLSHLLNPSDNTNHKSQQAENSSFPRWWCKMVEQIADIHTKYYKTNIDLISPRRTCSYKQYPSLFLAFHICPCFEM